MMSGKHVGGEEAAKVTPLPRVTLPASKPVTDAERRRRQELFAETMRLRDEIGPIDAPTFELVREGRDEA